MEFLTRTSCHNRNVFRVRLTDEELTYNESRLVTLADRHGQLSEDDWQRITNGEHPGHFGGRVQFHDNNEATIDVYTD